MPTILGLAGGPEAGGRTTTAVTGILAGAADRGAETEVLEVSRTPLPEAVEAIEGVDAVVFGSPVYRATYSALLEGVLEGTERGRWGETRAPLQGKAAAVVRTGATGHHFLAVNDLRDVLAGFFAVQVLALGLYLDHSAHVDRSTLTDDSAALAAGHGSALLDLAVAVRSSPRWRRSARRSDQHGRNCPVGASGAQDDGVREQREGVPDGVDHRPCGRPGRPRR